MSTQKSATPVTELDFDYIKQDIINYLKGQDEFSDYNFEGSAMNILVDILAYNTHMNAFMANMMANEMFLDSASIRQSVVSKAKEIGYIGRSCRSSKAIINVIVRNVADAPQEILLKAGTVFDSKGGYVFSTMRDYLLYPTADDSTVYRINDVEIYDGNYMEFHYEVDDSDPEQQFIIPAETVDTTTLRVFIQPDKTSSEIEEFYLNDDLNRLKPDSPVYFLHEHPEGYYIVTFGDGVIGKKVINGNYVTLSYIISVGREEANYNEVFYPVESIDGYNDYYVETVEPAFGGGEKEDIEHIKLLAPRMFQSQRRAVTIQDYETFLLHDYPWIDTINSWGGEDNVPPIYGKVFFAIKPKHTEFISDRLKEEIKNDLIQKYNVVTVVPEIIDPDYLYVIVNTTVYYNKTRTVLDDSQLQQKAINTIYGYFDATTEKFKLDFKFSPLVTRIDNTDPSFDSSLSEVYMEKRVYPLTNALQTFDIQFNNAIEKGTIETTFFNTEDENVAGIIYQSVIKDDGNGKLYLYCPKEDVVLDSDVGMVDYTSGAVSITVFPYALPIDTRDIRIYAKPMHKNIKSGYNQIIVPDESPENQAVNRRQGVTVTMVPTEEY